MIQRKHFRLFERYEGTEDTWPNEAVEYTSGLVNRSATWRASQAFSS